MIENTVMLHFSKRHWQLSVH